MVARRATWRRICSVSSSGLQTSGKKPEAYKRAKTAASIVRLEFGFGDGAGLQRVRDHDAPDVGPEESRDRVGVAGGFEDDVVVVRELTTEGMERLGGQIDPACGADAALVQHRDLGERAVGI
jgi:hypothetical protein